MIRAAAGCVNGKVPRRVRAAVDEFQLETMHKVARGADHAASSQLGQPIVVVKRPKVLKISE
jgi:hypothetical protein